MESAFHQYVTDAVDLDIFEQSSRQILLFPSHTFLEDNIPHRHTPEAVRSKHQLSNEHCGPKGSQPSYP
jgi:hypothetical protein